MFLNLEIKMFFRLIYIEWPFRRSHLPKELLTTKLLTVCLKIKMVGHSFFDNILFVSDNVQFTWSMQEHE